MEDIKINKYICAPNVFYKPGFLEYIKVRVAPYLPLLSHFGYEVCGIHPKDDTTNYIEGYHKVLKRDYYANQKSIKASRFIRKQAEFIKGKKIKSTHYTRL